MQAAPKSFPDAIVKNGERTVEIRMPQFGGGYWLYACVYDNHNGAAVATVPLFVTAETAGRKSPAVAGKAE